MQENDTRRDDDRLTELTADKQREVLHRWRQQSGMDGPRSVLPDTPDDPVAYKLLDAAGDAFGKGEVRQGVAILKLVAREYRHSQEAACARQALDHLKEQHAGR